MVLILQIPGRSSFRSMKNVWDALVVGVNYVEGFFKQMGKQSQIEIS